MSAIVVHRTELGAYEFDCPGCDGPHLVYVEPRGDRPLWSFTGGVERPTFYPSLLVSWTRHEPPVDEHSLDAFIANPWLQKAVQYVCHSFIKDGQIQFLGDCTHHLKNQTVPLKPYEE